MKPVYRALGLALVLSFSVLGYARAETYYCIELRPRPCEVNALTTHQLYSWFDNDLLHVGDIVRVTYWNTTSFNLTCDASAQNEQHRAFVIPSCGSGGGTQKGWIWFNSNQTGAEYEVVSISIY